MKIDDAIKKVLEENPELSKEFKVPKKIQILKNKAKNKRYFMGKRIPKKESGNE